MRHLRHRPLVAGLILTLGAGLASAQTWEYRSFKKGGMGGQYDKDRYVEGSLTLKEAGGRAAIQLVAGVMDACRRGELHAQVSRTDTEITIEPEITLAGCEKWRVVIRADGSGGRREVWRENRWVDTRWDHGLTLKQ